MQPSGRPHHRDQVGFELDHDTTTEQMHVVPSPRETVDLMFQRIKRIEGALTVPGTTSAEEAFNLLFARVRNIERILTEIKRGV